MSKMSSSLEIYFNKENNFHKNSQKAIHKIAVKIAQNLKKIRRENFFYYNKRKNIDIFNLAL